MSTLTKKYIKTFCKFLPHKEDFNGTCIYAYNISTCIVNGSYYSQLDSNRLLSHIPYSKHICTSKEHSNYKSTA